MRKEYDFSESIKNPYLNKAKKQVTIRLDKDTIAYFKALAAEKGIPYQCLINLYLRKCAESVKKTGDALGVTAIGVTVDPDLLQVVSCLQK